MGLKKNISLLGDGQDRGKSTPDLDSVHFLNVLSEEVVDGLRPGVERTFMILRVVWHNTIEVLGVDKLDDTTDEIAQIIE